MFRIYPEGIKLIIDTDETNVKSLLEFKRTITKYSPWLHTWEEKEIIDKLYENTRGYRRKDHFHFVLGMGWIPYLLAVFKNRLSQEEYNGLVSLVLAPTYRTIPFPNLRPEQNEDVLFILKYRRAVIQTRTSYGKSEVICTLANYAANELGKKVLLITPGKKASDELKKRYKLRFNYEITSGLDNQICSIITSGFLNRKDVKDPDLLKITEDKLRQFDWILVDELSYTINPSGKWIYDHLSAEVMYAFDATADKNGGKMLTFAKGITDTIMDNKDLISYFGPSLVYRMPINSKIDYITIRTTSLDHIKFTEEDFKSESNVFLEIMSKIWTNDEVCKVIVKLVKKYSPLFIPINDLNNIIYNWINNYFIPNHFRILLICFEGYIYYDCNGNKYNLTLEEASKYVENGLVDVIPGTSSSFKALDIQNMPNILTISSIKAGALLQQIGRVARCNHFRVISLESKYGKTIPIHTKNSKKRYEMIHDYYKYCEIEDIILDENNL